VWKNCDSERRFIVQAVDGAVKTIYSPSTALQKAKQFQSRQPNPKEPIVITRPIASTSSTRSVVRVAFAHAASMGACALATRRQQLLANGYKGRAHPGMEDV
jgi:hypothetical protein